MLTLETVETLIPNEFTLLTNSFVFFPSSLFAYAAHCVSTKSPREIKVRVGLHHLDDEDIADKTYDVEQIHLPDYTTINKPGKTSGSE